MEHRCSYRTKRRVTVLLHGDTGKEVLGRTRDISMGGMFVETGERMFPVNAVLDVSFSNREGEIEDDAVRVKMIVVHHQRGVGMGFMFCSLNENARRFLTTLLEQPKAARAFRAHEGMHPGHIRHG